jgi:hypothetical protein
MNQFAFGFVAGWLCAAIFIAVGIWLHERWKRTQRALEFPDTAGFLIDYRPTPVTRRVRAGRAPAVYREGHPQ